MQLSSDFTESKACFGGVDRDQTAEVIPSPAPLVGWQTDFGPVDDSLLAGLDPYKDASTSGEVHQEAIRKHHLVLISK